MVGGLIVGGIALVCVVLWMRARYRMRERSRFLLGESREDEARLSARAGVDLRRFFILSQRLLWGQTQPDLFTVDLDAVIAELLGEYPDFFVAHLVVAFIRREQGKDELADQALARAREIEAKLDVPPERSLRHLLPSEEEWAGIPPPVSLQEVVPGVVWRVPAYFVHGVAPLHEVSNATIVRRRDGGLVIYNPVEVPLEIRDQILALGEVTHLVIATKFHNHFIEASQRLFPRAKTYGVRGHLNNPPSKDLHFDGFLQEGEPLFPGEIDEFAFGGHEFEEVVMIHRDTRTAILHDLLVSNRAGLEGHTFWIRLYSFCWGIDERVGVLSYQVILWTKFLSVRRTVRALLLADVERVLVAHGPVVPAPGESPQLHRALGWVCQLGPIEHLVLIRDFFGGQPGFFRDFVKYMIRG